MQIKRITEERLAPREYAKEIFTLCGYLHIFFCIYTYKSVEESAKTLYM